MITYSFLQHYWWILISILGAVLVFMLFVQGGQSMLATTKDRNQRSLMVNSLGRKWELTFTSLVRRGILCLFSIVLLHKFRRCILVVDAYSVHICRTGGFLQVSQ